MNFRLLLLNILLLSTFVFAQNRKVYVDTLKIWDGSGTTISDYNTIPFNSSGQLQTTGIADNSITSAKISTGGVEYSNLSQAVKDSISLAGTPDDVTLEKVINILQVKDGGISNSKLAGSITDSKLSQITTANKVAGSAVQLNSAGGISNSSGLKVNTDESTITTSVSNIVQVKTGGIDWTQVSEVVKDSIRAGYGGTPTFTNSPDAVTIKENTSSKLKMVDSYLVPQKNKKALEQLNVNVTAGSPQDTIWSKPTVNSSWGHYGRVQRWQPTSTVVFNNFAFKRHSGTMSKDDTLYIYESADILSTDADITDATLLTSVVQDKDTWDAIQGFEYLYHQDITAVAGRYYYFYWKDLSEIRTVSNTTDTETGTASYFWNTGTGDWSGTATQYCFQVRYNSGQAIKLDIPTTNLTGTITNAQLDPVRRETIKTDAVVAPIWKNALEQLSVTSYTAPKSVGTVIDTLEDYSTSVTGSWTHYGRISVWRATVSDTFNNFAWKKNTSTMTDDDTIYVFERSATSITDATILASTLKATLILKATEWNAASSGDWIRLYCNDVAVQPDYYYYFYWKETGETRSVKYGTGSGTSTSLFYNTGTGNWSNASPRYQFQIRYNSDVKFELEVGTANISNIVTTSFNDNLSSFIGGTQADASNPLRLLLPDTIWVAGGQEANIYFDNIILTTNKDNFVFQVTCSVGKTYEDYWRYTPAEATTGTYALTVNVYNWSNQLVGTASTVISVAAGGAIPSATNIMFIGNSLTAANTFPNEVKTLAGANLTAIGTQGSTPHEGYSGKTYGWFESDVSSPFVLSTGGDLDVRGYLDSLTFSDPDLVFIHLGTNDAIDGVDTSAILANADSLIAALKADIPGVKIGVAMIIPPSKSQDSFGTNYDNNRGRWEYRNYMHTLNEGIRNHFRGVAQVSVVPVYMFIDTENNMATTTTQLNARNTDTYERQTNGVHPATSGYYQMADAIYGWVVNKD